MQTRRHVRRTRPRQPQVGIQPALLRNNPNNDVVEELLARNEIRFDVSYPDGAVDEHDARGPEQPRRNEDTELAHAGRALSRGTASTTFRSIR